LHRARRRCRRSRRPRRRGGRTVVPRAVERAGRRAHLPHADARVGRAAANPSYYLMNETLRILLVKLESFVNLQVVGGH
jgi:hypothetical protein